MPVDYGIKISKPGFDVKTAAKKDLIFSSELPCLKVINGGRENFTINSGATSNFTKAHGTTLPIFPLVFLYQPDSAGYKMAVGEAIPNFWSDFLHINFSFDSTNIYITVNNFTGAQKSTHFLWFVGYT